MVVESNENNLALNRKSCPGAFAWQRPGSRPCTSSYISHGFSAFTRARDDRVTTPTPMW